MSAHPLPTPPAPNEMSAVDVLLVTPNSRLRQDLSEKLHPPRWELSTASSGAEAMECLHEKPSDILLLDPLLPDFLSAEFADLVRERFPSVQVLSINSHTGQLVVGSTSPTPLSMRLAEIIYRPEGPSRLQAMLEATQPHQTGLRGMVGESSAMQHIFEMAHLVARRDTTVLITGESGTGKDLIAQGIHLLSTREKQPFVVINCAAIPEALLEAELFGHVKGSFTGAVQSRIGRIHAAHGGTLFLDEIGDMPLTLQSKILRFLEQGEVQRIGGNDNLKVDVRVIAATNAQLQDMVKNKSFREDLYYRLSVFPVQLPPLRERDGDIEILARSFVQKFCPGTALSDEALGMLMGHAWPGNVRELRNVLERACILVGSQPEIQARHISL